MLTPPIGDFSWYPCDIYRVGLDKTFKAVTNCNAWGYLSHFNPKPDEGFKWTDDGVVNLKSLNILGRTSQGFVIF